MSIVFEDFKADIDKLNSCECERLAGWAKLRTLAIQEGEVLESPQTETKIKRWIVRKTPRLVGILRTLEKGEYLL